MRKDDSNSGTIDYLIPGTCSTSSGDWYNTASNSTATTSTDTHIPWFYLAPKRILVRRPDGWSLNDELEFANLLNTRTSTGWICEMVIDGDVVVCDPSIEVRDMDDFVPLLLQRAGARDRDTIRQFFSEIANRATPDSETGEQA